MPPNPSPKIPLSEIAKLEHLIDQEPAREPNEVSKRQAVAMLAPKLYEMRRKGYAWRDVAAWLSGHGMTMSAAALQRHLRGVKDVSVRGEPARTRHRSRRRQGGRSAGACRVHPRGGRPDGPGVEGVAAARTAGWRIEGA